MKVRCDGCQATFDIDERRIPKTGLRARCPKCGATVQVAAPGGGATAGAGAAGAPPPPPPLRRPPAGARPGSGLTDEIDLPAPAGLTDLPSPARSGAGATAPGHADLPRPVAPRGRPMTAPSDPFGSIDDLPAPAAPRGDFGDLPAVAGHADLPAPVRKAATDSADFGDVDLPAVADNAGLPALAANAGLPALAGAAGLPAPKQTADLPRLAPSAGLPTPVPGPAAGPGSKPRARTLVGTGPATGRAPVTMPGPGTGRKTPPPMAVTLDDLPVQAGPSRDLPRPVQPSVGVDSLDDPFARGGADLPSPRADGLDLPSPKTDGVDLPATRLEGDDLPSPSDAVGLPGRPKGNTAIGRVQLQQRAVAIENLPAASAGLPVPSGAAGLPATSGGAALPATSSAAGLPATSTAAGLPSKSNAAGLPQPVSARGGAGPTPFEPGSLHSMPPLPPPPGSTPSMRPDGGFGELDLPLGDDPQGVPLVSSSSVRASSRPAAPLGSPSGRPPDFGDLPLPPSAGDAGMTRAKGGGMGFGEVDLGGGDAPASGSADAHPGESGEFAEIPLEKSQTASPSGAAVSMETSVDPRAERRPRPEVAAPPAAQKSSKALYIVLGVFALIVVGGAALSLTSLGAFGTKFIDERLHGAERHQAAQRVITRAIRDLELDDFGHVRAALRTLESQQLQTPNEFDLVAFNAYAHYFTLARFGNDTALAGRARALFDRVASLPSGTRYVGAARAARDLATGHAPNVTRAPRTDAATRDLVTMALLDGTDPSAALEAATAAHAAHPSHRTRFLLARAYFVSGDRASARREAESLATEAPQHAGSRLLLASLLGEVPELRERAIAYAREVEAFGANGSSDERAEAAVMVGQIEFRRDHVTAAREAFERALTIDPRSPTALVGAGTILYRQSSYTDALARFQAAQSADPDDVDAKLGIAMASIALNRPGDARSTLEPLVADHGSDARIHFWLGKALVAMNELQSAEREFRESIRLDNANLDGYTTLASLLFSMQRPEAAERVLEDARAHVTDLSSIHRALGEGRAARGDLPGAERELRAALESRGDDQRARFLLAQTLRRLRRFEDAGRELDVLGRAESTYPGLLLERGLLAEARGDATSALATFRAALEQNQGNDELIVRVAAALVSTRQYAEAETMLSRFLVDHPNVAEAHYVLGRARLAQGNTTDAVRLLERATELDSTRADFRAYAAEANLDRGQIARALEHANQSITLDANYARGYLVRGEVRVRQGAVREALVDANQALRLDPTLADALVTLAEADEALGHIQEAIILYQRAVQQETNRGDWFARLGQFQSDVGRNADAVVSLTRATALGDAMSAPPPWLARAHRTLGDLVRPRDTTAARTHYRRFIELSPPTGPGVSEVRGILSELGG